MTGPQAWGLASGVVDVASFPVYVWGIFRPRRGRKPRSPARVGWIMFGLFYVYLAAAQAVAGASWSDVIAVTEAVGCAWIAFLSLRHGSDDLVRDPRGRWWLLPVLNPVTALCFGLLAAVCAAWPLLPDPARVAAVVAVDAIAVTQVVAYTRRHGGESAGSWALFGVAGGLSGGAVAAPWPSILYLYPVAAEIFGVAVLWALWVHSLTPAAGMTPANSPVRARAENPRVAGPLESWCATVPPQVRARRCAVPLLGLTAWTIYAGMVLGFGWLLVRDWRSARTVVHRRQTVQSGVLCAGVMITMGWILVATV